MTQKWWVLTAVACGTFMATLDSSIVNIALPSLTRELGADLERVKWVVMAYLLVISCLMLPFGLLSDQKGRKRIFQVGFLVFVLGSALCGLALNLPLLIFFRMIQAVGAAMLMANGPAIITGTFGSHERGTALGTLAMVVSAGLMAGPGLGGVLISKLGWRSIFWINVPVGIIGVGLVEVFIRESRQRRASLPFDWLGSFLQTLILCVFIGAVEAPLQRFSNVNPILLRGGAFALLGVLLILFLRVEASLAHPLFDLSLFKKRTFWTSILAGFLTFVAFQSVTVLMPFFLQQELHFSPEKAGLLMTAIPVIIFLVAPLSGRLSDQFGSRMLTASGAGVGTLGLWFMSATLAGGPKETGVEWLIVASLSMIGLAMGLFQSPNNSAIMGCVPPQKLGVASALLATIRNLGLVTGTGLSSTLFNWHFEATKDYSGSFRMTLGVAGVVAAGAFCSALGRSHTA